MTSSVTVRKSGMASWAVSRAVYVSSSIRLGWGDLGWGVSVNCTLNTYH